MKTKKWHYEFSDWEHGYLRESAPPEDVLANLPQPIKRKANLTRNGKSHEKNKETYRLLVLPVIRHNLCPEALQNTALLYEDAEMLRESGYRLWVKGERFSLIALGDTRREGEVKAMGAVPRPVDEYWQLIKAAK